MHYFILNEPLVILSFIAIKEHLRCSPNNGNAFGVPQTFFSSLWDPQSEKGCVQFVEMCKMIRDVYGSRYMLTLKTLCSLSFRWLL